ncbi:MAG: hypothetical protein CMJ81_19950 [Planctomycetaceae bacterium]|nr:hypothetical protein [Planctomycetaceae bacterium]MBP62504.1 hypothetical protein [Planctomycetaceae bacterium]
MNSPIIHRILTLVITGCLLTCMPNQASSKSPQASHAAVERTRQVVRMLDDVYKTAVVLITEHYVKTDEDLAAGSAAKALFAAVEGKGWHRVQLLDATGEPYNDANVPTEPFDIAAIKKLKQGSGFVDEVIEVDGTQYLRAATPIPVVMEKCTMCHDNYKDVKAGEPIGILSYKIPIR